MVHVRVFGHFLNSIVSHCSALDRRRYYYHWSVEMDFSNKVSVSIARSRRICYNSNTDMPSVPMGCVALALLAFVMPARLEVEPAASYELANNGRGLSRRSLRRVDLLGATLLLGTCLLLATAFQKAAEGHRFSSSVVLPLLVIGPLLGVAFMAWEWHTTTRRTAPEPILPWRFFQSRSTLGMML